jgi:hypothetical protein
MTTAKKAVVKTLSWLIAAKTLAGILRKAVYEMRFASKYNRHIGKS